MTHFSSRLSRLLVILGALQSALASCSGHVVGRADAPPPSDEPPAQTPPDDQLPRSCAPVLGEPRAITHLTRTFYNNTVRDLLGDESRPADTFPLDDSLSGFEVGRHVSDRLTRDLAESAERLAARAVLGVESTLSCRTRDRACAMTFIEDFLGKAFRRPAETAEVEAFAALFDDASTRYDFRAGLEIVIQAALTSPQFLYFIEADAHAAWNTASRLSYFLTGSMPDAELRAAAAEGRLSSPKDLAAQAERLLGTNRYGESMLDLARQWFGLSDIAHVSKPGGALSPAAPGALEKSALAFAEDALVRDGSLSALLLGTRVSVDRELASLYGVPPPAPGAWHEVETPAGQRAGILTQAGLLAKLGKGLKPDAIHRGVFVRRALLCEVLAPPANVPPLPDGEDLSEQIKSHVANPACRGCHDLIDPVGFAFDAYDGLGRHRTTDDRGKAIVVAGELREAGTASGPFEGVRELAERLSRSEVVEACAVRRVFRHALRRAEQDEEECLLERVQERFALTEGSFADLAVAITQMPTFAYRAESSR